MYIYTHTRVIQALVSGEVESAVYSREKKKAILIIPTREGYIIYTYLQRSRGRKFLEVGFHSYAYRESGSLYVVALTIKAIRVERE